MRRPVVLIVTSSFPYGSGEQFLESEITYWACAGTRVVVAPVTAPGAPRRLPPGVELRTDLAESRSLASKVLHAALALVHPITRRDVTMFVRLRGVKSLRLRTVLDITFASANSLQIRRSLFALCQQLGSLHVYSYWDDVASYAAALLKREGIVLSLVSRAHGFDIYEERRSSGWMPLKRQFADDFDLVAVVSGSGRDYYVDRYRPRRPERVRTIRLGVRVPDLPEQARSHTSRLNLLTLSACVPVKRLHLMVDALEIWADRFSGGRTVHWTHVGDGPLFHELRESTRKLEARGQVTVRLAGRLSNDRVLAELRAAPFDAIVNVSSSEGVPVSLMEAMAHGIPAVATDVGGTRELVEPGGGFLLPADITAAELAAFFDREWHSITQSDRRMRAHAAVRGHYADRTNYPAMIELVKETLEEEGQP